MPSTWRRSSSFAYFSKSARNDLAWYFWGFWLQVCPANSTLNSSCPCSMACALASVQPDSLLISVFRSIIVPFR